ncbi:MAG: hypothetical protein AAFY29_13715 [Pseudomonadota bacterium]
MTVDSERFDRNERRNSLAAFLRAIRFRKPKRANVVVERDFAQLHPRAPQHHRAAEDGTCVRSAN